MSIVNTVQAFLNKRGFNLTKGSKKEDVVALIKSLRPRVFNKGLIRLGPDADGGYLVPNDLEGIEACFSPGVDVKCGFEESCAEHGMYIYMVDRSIEKPLTKLNENQYQFQRFYLGAHDTDELITLDKWVTDSNYANKDLLLQMDIEGHEYPCLLNVSENVLTKFRIIVIEIHLLHRLWDYAFFFIAQLMFQKLLKHFYCVHIHPNNVSGVDSRMGVEIPRAAEFTFIRKDRMLGDEPFASSFPHAYDIKNSPQLPDQILPKIWFTD